jgi:hypothetical protein
MPSTTPRFKRVSPGVYDSEDGRFEMYRIEGVNPPAWNVEYSADWVEAQVAADPEHVTWGSFDMVVDGAASMRDAVAIFAEMFERGEIT